MNVSIRLRRLLLLALTLLAISPHGAPSRVEAKASDIAARLDTFMAAQVKLRAFRGAVLAAGGSGVLLSRGYDWANVANRIPNTAQTEFPLAAISFEFTQTALLQLREQGKLLLANHLCVYIPACPSAWQPIALQDLVLGMSGLADDLAVPRGSSVVAAPLTPLQLIDLVKTRPFMFAPGTQRDRTENTDGLLLAYVVSEVAGEPFAAYIQQHILTPLHLSQTGFITNRPRLPRQATGYSSWVTERTLSFDASLLYGASGMYASVGDLYQWDTAFHGSRLLSAASHDLLFSRARTGTLRGHRVFIHGGALPGYRSVAAFYPDDGAYIVVLSNLEMADSAGLAQQLQDILFAKPAGQSAHSAGQAPSPAGTPTPTPSGGHTPIGVGGPGQISPPPVEP